MLSVSNQKLMQKVCNRAKTSELCNNWELFAMIQEKANNGNVPMWFLLGIMSKESGLGTLRHHTNRSDCRSNTYNWHGSKGYNNGTKTIRGNIGPGCWLYKYDSLEQGMESLANTIGKGYRACRNRGARAMVECVSYRYVGNPDVSEHTRVNHIMGRYVK